MAGDNCAHCLTAQESFPKFCQKCGKQVCIDSNNHRHSPEGNFTRSLTYVFAWQNIRNVGLLPTITCSLSFLAFYCCDNFLLAGSIFVVAFLIPSLGYAYDLQKQLRQCAYSKAPDWTWDIFTRSCKSGLVIFCAAATVFAVARVPSRLLKDVPDRRSAMTSAEAREHKIAVRDCTNVIEKDSRDGLAYAIRADALYRMGKLHIADQDKTVAERLRPGIFSKSSEVSGDLPLIADHMTDEFLGALTDRFPTHTWNLLLQADMHGHAGEHLTALEYYNKAVALRKDDETLTLRGEELWKIGRYAEALGDLLHAILLNPTYVLSPLKNQLLTAQTLFLFPLIPFLLAAVLEVLDRGIRRRALLENVWQRAVEHYWKSLLLLMLAVAISSIFIASLCSLTGHWDSKIIWIGIAPAMTYALFIAAHLLSQMDQRTTTATERTGRAKRLANGFITLLMLAQVSMITILILFYASWTHFSEMGIHQQLLTRIAKTNESHRTSR